MWDGWDEVGGVAAAANRVSGEAVSVADFNRWLDRLQTVYKVGPQ